jgi:hypothetical protein
VAARIPNAPRLAAVIALSKRFMRPSLWGNQAVEVPRGRWLA